MLRDIQTRKIKIKEIVTTYQEISIVWRFYILIYEPLKSYTFLFHFIDIGRKPLNCFSGYWVIPLACFLWFSNCPLLNDSL